MAKPTSQERRKQALRQRRAEEQREFDRQDAGYLYGDAVRAHRSGDIPAADRFLKKTLILDPNHAGAMGLLFEIHRVAGHYAEALGYLQRRRKVDADPKVLYNIAGMYQQLGQAEKAIEATREFLAEIKGRHEPEWQRLRKSAESVLQLTRPTPVPENSRRRRPNPPHPRRLRPRP